jgi:phosphatidylglycerophosphate synthase
MLLFVLLITILLYIYYCCLLVLLIIILYLVIFYIIVIILDKGLVRDKHETLEEKKERKTRIRQERKVFFDFTLLFSIYSELKIYN